MDNYKREIITIEGNIGSGKTTLINKLQESLKGDYKCLFKIE